MVSVQLQLARELVISALNPSLLPQIQDVDGLRDHDISPQKESFAHIFQTLKELLVQVGHQWLDVDYILITFREVLGFVLGVELLIGLPIF